MNIFAEQENGASALGARIKLIRKRLGYRQEELAGLLGVSQNMVSRYERGDVQPKVEVLEKLAGLSDVGKQYGYFWLITGMEIDVAGMIRSRSGLGDEEAGEDDAVYIPQLDSTGEETGRIAFSKSLLTKEGLPMETLGMIRAVGDYMSPTIDDGDTMLIDLSVNEYDGDAVYVLEIGGALSPRRIQKGLDNTLIVKPDNPKWGSQTVAGEDAARLLKIAGRVVWIGRSP